VCVSRFCDQAGEPQYQKIHYGRFAGRLTSLPAVLK